MKRLAVSLTALLSCSSLASAQVLLNGSQLPSMTPTPIAPASGSLFGTNALQTCGPVTGTLAAVGDTVALPAGCNGFATTIISVRTAAGDSAFVGTFSSSDTLTGAGRRLIKNGSNALQISSETLNGTQGNLDYRTIGGNGAQAITATAYTSGKATVTLTALAAPTAFFINGGVETVEGAACRQGRCFTTSATLQVTGGQYLNFYVLNPSNSGNREIITSREIMCDNPSGQIASRWYGLRNPTVNIPSTTATIQNRDNPGPAINLTAMYGASTAAAVPDQATSVPIANRIGGIIPANGDAGGGPDKTMALFEPGQAFVLSVLAQTNAGTGLGANTNPYCSIFVTGYLEPAY